MGDAGDDGSAAEGLVGCDEGSAPGVVCSAFQGRCHGEAPCTGYVFDPEGSVGEAAVVIRSRRNFSTGGEVEVADVAVAVAEDVDCTEGRIRGLRCEG